MTTGADFEGRVARQVGKRGYYAAVWVCQDPSALDGARIAPDAYVYDADWRDAAVFGVDLGRQLAGYCGGFVVTQIKGMCVDTSPVLVAIAAARAVWAAVGFAPSQELGVAVEEAITAGHRTTLQGLTQVLHATVKA